MKWVIVIAGRAILLAGFVPVMAWTVLERLAFEARSTLRLLRWDLLEGVHYFRQAWRRLPSVAATMTARKRDNDSETAA